MRTLTSVPKVKKSQFALIENCVTKIKSCRPLNVFWQFLILLLKCVSRQHQCLSALVRFCGVVGSNFGEPKVVRSHGLKLLSTLLEVDTANPSILEFDAFGILVSLTFSLPSLFNGDQAAPLPSGNIQDANILRLVYVAHIVQILLTTDQVIKLFSQVYMTELPSFSP